MVQQVFVCWTFTFPSLFQLPSSPWKSQTSTPNNLFFLYLKMVFLHLKVKVSVTFVSYSVLPGLSHVYLLLNFCRIFSYYNLSYINLILRPASRTWKCREKFLLPENMINKVLDQDSSESTQLITNML